MMDVAAGLQAVELGLRHDEKPIPRDVAGLKADRDQVESPDRVKMLAKTWH
ncbi:hypothetical protein [Lichenibacterium ramalinae]|uniref:hypothetical protein n=1 Tax=Lichenibacterium ramalinae TaxID=2316527 RepID=UPI0013EAA7CA|nr:hypothetical protein [Lichenibacterium ramalinae]